MTTVVTIAACCGDAKEVHVVVTEAGSLVEEFNIANGEKAERYAYDDRVISVKEVVKVDRRAKEIEDAEFSLRQATLRYEDAASRGFPLGNQSALKIDVEVKVAELDALLAPRAPEVTPEASLEVAPADLSPEAVKFLDSLDPAPAWKEPRVAYLGSTAVTDIFNTIGAPPAAPFADLTSPAPEPT